MSSSNAEPAPTPTPFKGTIAIDSLGEWARLTFAKEQKRERWNVEKVRAVNDYPGMTERIAIICRRLKEVRDSANVNIVVTAHEGIDRIYAKGGAIAKKGESAPEPIDVLGRPDIPGTSATAELLRAFDNIFRVRLVNGKYTWVARPENIGGGGNTWEVKDRFNAMQILNGYLPNSYSELRKLALANPLCANWQDRYLFLLYGPQGYQKTRSLLTFPAPIYLHDIDRGATSIFSEWATCNGKTEYYGRPLNPNGTVHVTTYEPDDASEYERFISNLFSQVLPPVNLTSLKKVLGL